MKFPTIEPEDKFPRVPNALAFIIYRFLPIFCLTTFSYCFFQRHSFYEHIYLSSMWWVASGLIIRVFRPEVRSWDHFLGYWTLGKIHHILYFICIVILVSRFGVQYGVWTRWNVARLGPTAECVRYYCGSIDYERATESKRKELEWWIEGLLRDDSDCFALAEERRRIVIAPLQRMVRENKLCEGLTMAGRPFSINNDKSLQSIPFISKTKPLDTTTTSEPFTPKPR
ncbi:hypothetical protein BOTNAR_0466g00010 [Botryotinia narcissicola]|uniref:Uncharacterized protein n=1 Tax=Botryotinia narcissicola TaxID=278944 RepID=A0A4Z1HIL0_9HELO|nr:hypothetical protein BOTNAR_0466g00010 [Botryotinia narcissicola]